MNQETTIPRKRYDEAFKRSAVQHWQTSGKSAALVAHELGLNAGTLAQWKKRWGTEPPATGLRTVESARACELLASLSAARAARRETPWQRAPYRSPASFRAS